MNTDNTVLVRGSRFTVEYQMLADGTMPGRDFVAQLKDSDRTKVLALFQRLAEYGRIENREKCKKVTDAGIWEIKSFQIRMFWFHAPDRKIIIATGLIKKSDRLRTQDISRAEEMRSAYFKQRGRGTP